jgi:hypothetical protein
VPAIVVEATVKVSVDVPVPLMEDGLKATVTPAGVPEAVKATAESKPPLTVLVIFVLPELPCAIDTDAGDAERLNPEGAVAPVSAVSRPVFGLPHPVTKSKPVSAE